MASGHDSTSRDASAFRSRRGTENADFQAAGESSAWSQLWGQQFGPDQDVEVTISSPMGSGNPTYLYGRVRDEHSSDITGYALVLAQSYWDPDVDTWEIHKITSNDDDDDTILATNDNGAPARAGLQMRFVLRGSHLTGYALLNDVWVEQVSTIDTSYHPAVSRVGLQGTYSGGRLDNFRASSDSTIRYAHDRMNRLTGINYSDDTPDVTYTYDDGGRRQTMNDGAGTESYDYDDDNRLTAIARTGSDDGTNGVMSYGYDPVGNINSRTYPDGTDIDATYTDDNLVETIASAGATTSLGYDAADNLTTTTLPSANGYVETRDYDQAGRLDDIQNTSGSTTLSDYALALNEDGAPTRVALTRDATTTYQAFQYDDRSRLTDACYDITSIATDCTGATEQLTYSYDKASNRTSQLRTGVADAGTTEYTYNDANQLTGTDSGGHTKPYSYDDRGNQTSNGTSTSFYNLANELTTTRSNGAKASYGYDGDGKRLSADTSGGDLRYSWDPLADTGMAEIAHERLPDGTRVRDYITSPTGPLSLTNIDDTYYYHHDWQGSTSDITDSTGTPQWAYDYEPYGALLAATNVSGTAPDNPLLYTGQYRDSQTGLYNLRARQYDSTTGSFDATDPLAQTLISPATSSYGYVDGMPTTLYDPLGLSGLPGSGLVSDAWDKTRIFREMRRTSQARA